MDAQQKTIGNTLVKKFSSVISNGTPTQVGYLIGSLDALSATIETGEREETAHDKDRN